MYSKLWPTKICYDVVLFRLCSRLGSAATTMRSDKQLISARTAYPQVVQPPLEVLDVLRRDQGWSLKASKSCAWVKADVVSKLLAQPIFDKRSARPKAAVIAVLTASTASATRSATCLTSAGVLAVTVMSCELRSPRRVTITFPGLVAQASWITRLRAWLASRQSLSAASNASLSRPPRSV
jgi:hypothetical protein